MLQPRRLTISLLLLISLWFSTALAQEQKKANAPAAPLLTATASAAQVRFVGLGEVREMRLQLFDISGQQVYDSSSHPGNLLDYQLADQQGARLSDGSYLFVVTIKDFAGQLSQKYGVLISEAGGPVSLSQVSTSELTSAQATALEANGQSAQRSPVDRIGAAAVVSMASDTTTQSNAASAKTKSISSSTAMPDAGSTTVTTNGGTTNQIAKWSDGTGGVLTDSAITESGGNVGIGTTTPLHPLDIFTTQAAGQGLRVVNPNAPALTFSDNVSNSYRLQMETTGDLNFKESSSTNRVTFQKGGNVGIGTANPTATLHLMSNAGAVVPFKFTNTATGKTWHLTGGSADNNFYFTETGVDVRLALQAGGNVGIGTINPGQKLSVNGTIESLSGGFKFPNGVTQTTPFTVPLSLSSSSSSSVLTSFNSGTGDAGFFRISNPANPNSALKAFTDGAGFAVAATTSGSGVAGAFQINNPANNTPALEGITDGSGVSVIGLNSGIGPAGLFTINNTNNSSIALRGSTFGTGPAGSFQISNADNSSNALEVTTNGTGLAGKFDGGVDVNNARLRVSKNGGNSADIQAGDRYRDNAIIAWAKVLSSGSIPTSGTASFGISSVTKLGTGSYEIIVQAAATVSSYLIPVAVAELSAQPTSAATLRIVSVDQSTTTKFRVYINDGTGAAVDNNFVFMVTAR